MNYNTAEVCPKCKIITSNLQRHRRRDRCNEQHIRKSKKIIKGQKNRR